MTVSLYVYLLPFLILACDVCIMTFGRLPSLHSTELAIQEKIKQRRVSHSCLMCNQLMSHSSRCDSGTYYVLYFYKTQKQDGRLNGYYRKRRSSGQIKIQFCGWLHHLPQTVNVMKISPVWNQKNPSQWKTGFFQLRRQGAESADGASRPHFERVGLDCTPPCSCRYFWQPPLCSWSESTKSPQVPHTECCQKTRLANAVERLRGKFFRHEIKIWQYWWWSGKEHPMFWPYYSCELVEHVLAVSLVNYALVDAFMHRSGEAGSFRC